jgi:long-chain acyl-CoA synthetase
MRGNGEGAAGAIERANRRLAEFQRLRRWVLWPEPDLPRTSTGKVRRKSVAEWLKELQSASAAIGTGEGAKASASAFGASADWLLALIAEITGETPTGVGDELRLTEDLQLDSLGRVQLAAAIEERLGMAPESGLLEETQTLGELRRLAAGKSGSGERVAHAPEDQDAVASTPMVSAQDERAEKAAAQVEVRGIAESDASSEHSIYPRWPWLRLVQWVRAAFVEAVVRPLVWLLAHPRVVAPKTLAFEEPVLIIANHVTAYDGPLVQYALPGPVRRRIAAAMAGDMLDDYRHFRNPERPPGKKGFFPPGPLFYLLLTALFNVFPLPRRHNFQRSFAHAGAAMDRGYSVLVFPEGTRSAAGELARFRGGIGLLVKQSGAKVLPVALCGLGELKASGRRWFRSGKIEVRVGEPIRFAPEESEAAITARLHEEVEQLLEF